MPISWAGIDAGVVQRDLQLVRALHDVAVGQDEAVAGDDEAGAAALAPLAGALRGY